MSQAAFQFSPPVGMDSYAAAIAVLCRDPLGFKAVTEGWLRDNATVWREFYASAEALRLAGRHYGAKCIYEHMRYESAVRDAEITFKLNNNHVSGLARLYNRVAGVEYFEVREGS